MQTGPIIFCKVGLLGCWKIFGLVSGKLCKLAFGFGLALSCREKLGLIWGAHSLARSGILILFLCCSPEHAQEESKVRLSREVSASASLQGPASQAFPQKVP